MDSELSFLIKLLLDHKLPKITKDLVASRVKEVEAAFKTIPIPIIPAFVPPAVPATYVKPVKDPNAQSPSTMKILQDGGPLPVPIIPVQDAPVTQGPVTPAVIAQTPATAAALANRNALLSQATSGGAFTGKPEAGRTAPRKF